MINAKKHILITGATGYLGPDIVRGLLDEGYKVTSVSRHEFALNKDISNASSNFQHYIYDIQSKVEFKQILENISLENGKFDGLLILANKGTRKIELDEHEDSFFHNLGLGPKTTYITITSALELLNTNSSVIIFGSIWGLKTPYKNIYLDLPIEPSLSLPASKAALMHLARSFAVELATKKVRVNLLTPGWFPKPGKIDRPDYIDGINARTPLGRIGIPADLVGPVKFLLSESSNFITGQNLIVDGGFSLY